MDLETSDQEGRKRKRITERKYIPQFDRSTNEQDRFLDYCQRNRIKITVFLESGRPFQGLVVEHDRKVLLLGPMRQDKDQRMIQKSYISLVRAEEVLPLFLEYKGRGNFRTRKKERLEAKLAAKEALAGLTKKLSVRRKTPGAKPQVEQISGVKVMNKPTPRKHRPTTEDPK